MRVSKMNEDRLVEVRRKKYLNELLDFYLYGDCLDEDMAEEYFDSIKENITELSLYILMCKDILTVASQIFCFIKCSTIS